LDFSLVSNKNFSEILPSSRLGLGLDEVDKKGLNYSYFPLQTQRLAESFRVWTAL